jgi:hypothetical protein
MSRAYAASLSKANAANPDNNLVLHEKDLAWV